MVDERLDNILTQYYRGEISRVNTWRTRMDRTTNWSVVITAAVITWVFSNTQRTHLVLLFGFFLVIIFLIMESRRYRFYDLWRARIRILEEYYLCTSLCPDISKPKNINWKKTLGEDLKKPRFKITILEAVSRRLKRIYIWILIVIFSSWLIKLLIHPKRTSSFFEILNRAKIGIIPGYFIFSVISLSMLLLIIITLLSIRKVPISERKAKGEIKEQKEEISEKWKK